MTQTPELHLKSEKGVNIRFYIHLSSPKSYTVKLVFKALPCWFSKMEQVIIQTTAAPWENMLLTQSQSKWQPLHIPSVGVETGWVQLNKIVAPLVLTLQLCLWGMK